MIAIDGVDSRMESCEFLRRHRSELIDAADDALARIEARHYRSAGEAEVRRRTAVLFEHLLDSLTRSDLAPMIAYAESVAEERFHAGYDLSEVQAAFNALEESIWTWAVASLEPGQLAQTLGPVGTVLGCGKDALARKYVSLATRAHAPSLDVRALFSGGGISAAEGERGMDEARQVDGMDGVGAGGGVQSSSWRRRRPGPGCP